MYYVKQALFGFVYLLFLAVSALGIMLIENIALVIVLLCLNLGLFIFLMFMYFIKEGEHAKEIKRANDLERREIIRTGEDRPLKEIQEYKPWKGFLTGALMAVPLLVFLLLYALIYACGGSENNFAGAVANFMYTPFFAFISVLLPEGATLSFGQYFIILYCIPFLSASAGVPYLIGAKKQQKKYDKIMDKQRMLYGDNYGEEKEETEEVKPEEKCE